VTQAAEYKRCVTGRTTLKSVTALRFARAASGRQQDDGCSAQVSGRAVSLEALRYNGAGMENNHRAESI
jgi:hypothetical protein